MLKLNKLLVATFFALSTSSALAVDITMTFTPGEIARFQAAVGKLQNLVDAQTPPQPRSATAAEAKTYAINRGVRQAIIDVEGAALTKQAVDTVVIPTFDPK